MKIRTHYWVHMGIKGKSFYVQTALCGQLAFLQQPVKGEYIYIDYDDPTYDSPAVVRESARELIDSVAQPFIVLDTYRHFEPDEFGDVSEGDFQKKLYDKIQRVAVVMKRCHGLYYEICLVIINEPLYNPHEKEWRSITFIGRGGEVERKLNDFCNRYNVSPGEVVVTNREDYFSDKAESDRLYQLTASIWLPKQLILKG